MVEGSKSVMEKLQGINWVKSRYADILIGTKKKEINDYELFLIEKLKTSIREEMKQGK